MPANQPEPTERDLLARLLQAVEALPEKIGEHVGYKLRFERRIQDDDERSSAEIRANREYEQRKRAEFEDAATERTGTWRWRTTTAIACLALAVGLAALLISIL